MGIARCVNQLDGDTHAIAPPLHAAFEESRERAERITRMADQGRFNDKHVDLAQVLSKLDLGFQNQ